MWSPRPGAGPDRGFGRRYRVFAASALLAGSLLGWGATAVPSASALAGHSAGGELIQVGSDEAILLSVNAETSAAMVSVDILFPPGFTPDLNRPPDARGGGVGGVFITWQAHVSGPQVVAGGDGVADGGVVLVNFSGTAARVGTLSFVTVTHAADGTTVRWDGAANSAHPAALVYVVKSLANPQTGAASLSGGASTGGASGSHAPWWAVAAAGVGGLALLGCVVTARRRRPAASGPSGPSGASGPPGPPGPPRPPRPPATGQKNS